MADTATQEIKETPAETTPANTSADKSQQETVVVTPEYIEEVARRGDAAEMTRIKEFLDNEDKKKSAPPEPAPAPEPPAAPAPTAAPAEAEPKQETSSEPVKKFKVAYRGIEHDFDDLDGLLGHKNTGALKKAYLKQKLYLKDIEGDREQLRDSLKTYEQKARELEERLKAPPPAPAPAPVAAAPKVELPQAPTMPDLPSDVVDWTAEHQKKFWDYQRAQNEYSQKIAQFVQAPRQEPPAPAPAQLPPEIQSELQTLRMEREQAAREKRVSEYWDRIESFQTRHKDAFTTPKRVRELHTEVGTWMDRLAQANGVSKPATPENPNDAQWQSYRNSRNVITQKFLDNDESVVKAAEGLEAPQGYDAYFKLVEIEKLHDGYKNQGKLGPKASIDDAYLLHLQETGELEKEINQIRATDIENATTKQYDALKKHQEFPSAIPPTISDTGSGPTGISKEDEQWFMNLMPNQIRYMDADNQARFQKIGKALGMIG